MEAKMIRRLVVKVGTSSLVMKNGRINLPSIDRLAYSLSALNNAGYQVVLVSSGAMGAGLASLNKTQRPAAIAEQQALASLGQVELMRIYSQRFLDYQTRIAQLLLTRDNLEYPLNRTNVLNTIEALLQQKIVPIINENDPVSVDELDHHTTFSDNDELSALVATRIGADLLIVLSDIDGLFDKDPHKNADAKLIENVTELTPAIRLSATGSSTRFGTGGMVTKLKAAETILNADRQMVLCNGQDPRVILKVVNGQPIGTHFGRHSIKPLATDKEEF